MYTIQEIVSLNNVIRNVTKVKNNEKEIAENNEKKDYPV